MKRQHDFIYFHAQKINLFTIESNGIHPTPPGKSVQMSKRQVDASSCKKLYRGLQSHPRTKRDQALCPGKSLHYIFLLKVYSTRTI